MNEKDFLHHSIDNTKQTKDFIENNVKSFEFNQKEINQLKDIVDVLTIIEANLVHMVLER